MGFVQKAALVFICLWLAMTDTFLSSNRKGSMNNYG